MLVREFGMHIMTMSSSVVASATDMPDLAACQADDSLQICMQLFKTPADSRCIDGSRCHACLWDVMMFLVAFVIGTLQVKPSADPLLSCLFDICIVYCACICRP